MVRCAAIWQKTNLAFLQNIVVIKKVDKSFINDVAEYFSQVTGYTYSSVVIWVIFISGFMNWGY